MGPESKAIPATGLRQAQLPRQDAGFSPVSELEAEVTETGTCSDGQSTDLGRHFAVMGGFERLLRIKTFPSPDTEPAVEVTVIAAHGDAN